MERRGFLALIGMSLSTAAIPSTALVPDRRERLKAVLMPGSGHPFSKIPAVVHYSTTKGSRREPSTGRHPLTGMDLGASRPA